MKKYHIVHFICNGLILCLGAALMIKPSLGMEDVNYLFFVIMVCYAMISYIHYMMIRRKDDYEHLFISLVSLIAGCGGLVLHAQKPTLVLSLSLMAWIAMVAVIKLIKIDYYNDRNNILWGVRTITFVLFLIIGTLTCVNLYYNIEIQSLMLGFFLISVSVLEIFDPVADYVFCKKIKKLGKDFKPEVINETGLKDLEAEMKKEALLAKKKVTTKAPASTKTVKKKSAVSKTTSNATKKTVSKTAAKKTTAVKKTTSTGTSKKTSAKKPATKGKTTTTKTKTSKSTAPKTGTKKTVKKTNTNK